MRKVFVRGMALQALAAIKNAQDCPKMLWRLRDAAQALQVLVYRAEHEVNCRSCLDEPVQDAASWLDGKWRPIAPCPTCGKVNRPVRESIEESFRVDL